MPMYSYRCDKCQEKESRIVPIANRDEQVHGCGEALIRGIDRPALVWAPTASNGAGHK